MTQQPSPVQPIAVHAQPFTHLHIDLVGRLPTAKGGLRYLLTMVDRSTRWLEAIPLHDMEGTTVADAFLSG